MRIRPLKPALLGAALLQRLELAVAQQFYWNGAPIQNKLLPTGGSPFNGLQETLVFTYTRPPLAPPVSLSLHRNDNGAELLRASLDSPGQMELKEGASTAAGINGTVTIHNPAAIAYQLSSVTDRTRVPAAVHFVFSPGLQDGSVQSLPPPSAFGIATPEVSQNNETLSQYASKMFPDGPVVTSTSTSTPIVTEFVPASTGTTATPTSSPGEVGVGEGGLPAQPAPDRSALSTGAIAGIAVGASLAVLLLATIIGWFLYWRRRRQKKTGSSGLGYGVGQGRAGDMVAEKEANAIVAESPPSPYSEDGHRRDSTLIGGASAVSSGAAGLMAAHHDDRDTAGEYPPYSDHPPTSTATAPPTISQPVARAGSSMSRSTADRSSAAIPGGAAPPPAIGEEGLPPRAETGMSGRYAHLVEDGMTPQEIARLEEEERQLDVAIEQARGVTTK